ncbi:glycosyltransferase family 8 protein [Clostridium sp. WB02_MRS01]|uniref:glycosyltransferase family 8 protein n=1 Tax=Clostridium sp. WB02_MRS01 TaxID=2605777 RepID=UPI0012B2EA8C|nr:glycosyltransferase family 8 protein [Clostridium sp. WB02_MRS01]MSS10121.1 glycosyltransferase family 8 protein [Clostridium sp. WB02_MRS01]
MVGEKINVIYASDDRFSEILGVSLLSLLENNFEKQISVFIMDSGITNKNKSAIEKMVLQYSSAELTWLTAKNVCDVIEMTVTTDRGSLSQYARLFLDELLPEDMQRVLYLDCDIIINQPIDDLWNIDLQENTIAALDDAFSKYYRDNINLQPDDIMFNSGVMLVDMEKWRGRKVEDRLLAFMTSKNGKVQQGDQGVLNAVLSRETFCFAPRFNAVTIYFDFNYREIIKYRKPARFYFETEIEEAMQQPVLIHFTTSFLSRRPWVKGCQHKYVSQWLYYKSKSPWAETPLWDYHAPRLTMAMHLFFKITPRRIAISVAGFLQAYGRPLMKKFRAEKR